MFQVLVLADNCTDQTAAIARREGATVVERRDPLRKSKGYAIEYLIDRLRESGTLESFDAIVIIDADTTVGQGSSRVLRRAARRATIGSSAATRSPTRIVLAHAVDGVCVQPIQRRQSPGTVGAGLGGVSRQRNVHLHPRPPARPWKIIGLVEDMEYSWKVRVAGGKVSFLPDACVKGQMVGHGGTAAASQRPAMGGRDARRSEGGSSFLSSDPAT